MGNIKKIFNRYCIKLLSIIVAANFCTCLYAQEPSENDATELLKLSLEELLNIDVTTASKSVEKQSDAPGIISILTRDELERFGGTTLRDILERVPGLISSGANFSNRTTIAVRGDQVKQNSSHVLVLINGRPAREVQEGGVSSDIFETFPVNIIEKIEVIKGPGSVLYGSDAFSGVINIITKKAEKNGFSVTALGENGGGKGASGDVTLKLGDLNIVAAGRYLEKSIWDAPYKTTYGIPAPPPVFSITRDTSITLNIPDKGPGAYLGVNYKGLSFMSSFNRWTNAKIQDISRENTKLTKNFNNLGYSFNLSETWNIDANITYTKSDMDGAPAAKRSSYNMVAELTNSINLLDNLNLTVGGLFNRNSGDEKADVFDFMTFTTHKDTVVSKGDVNSYAFYTQLDWRLIENLKLIGGIQLNKVGKLKISLVPRGGVIWYPVSRFSVKALYSEAYRAPSINENNMNYGGFFFGDPDLKPEKVSTIDVAIGYQGEQAQVGINFFRSKMTNIIQILGMFPRTYANADEVTFLGGELEGKYYVNKSLYLSGSALYQTNENDTISNLAPIANFGAKAGISYVWDKGITVSLFNIYQGGLDTIYTLKRNPNQGAYNLLHLHSKYNLNTLFNMSFKPVLSLFLDVDNLLDKPHYGYDLGGNSRDAIPSIPGRAIYFGLNVRF